MALCNCGAGGGGAAAGCTCRIDGSEAIDITGAGSTGSPFVASLVLDPTSTNAVITASGLRVTGAGGTGNSGGPGFLITDYGAVDTAATGTASFNAAINAATAAGGGTVLIPRQGVSINAAITIPDGVALRGYSTTPGTKSGSQIRTTTSTARLIFAGYGGTSGDFNIDGTLGGSTAGLIYLTLMDGRHFVAVSVSKAPGIGWLIEQAQNCQLDLCTSYHAVTDGFVFDRGCGGLVFNRIESAGSGQDGVSFLNHSAAPYGQPTHISFFGGNVEYKNTISGTFRNLLRMVAGSDIVFDRVRFGGIDVTGSDGYAVHIDSAELRLRDCVVAGNNQTTGAGLIYAKNSFLYLNGRNVFQLSPKAFTFDTSVGGWADRYDMSQVTTEFTMLNSATTSAFNVRGPTGQVLIGQSGGVFTFNASNVGIWQHFIAIVNVNSTCTNIPVGRVDGQQIIITASQSGGGHTFSWPANCRFTGAAPVLGTTSGAFVTVTFAANGANWDEVARSGTAPSGAAVNTVHGWGQAVNQNYVDTTYADYTDPTGVLTITIPNPGAQVTIHALFTGRMTAVGNVVTLGQHRVGISLDSGSTFAFSQDIGAKADNILDSQQLIAQTAQVNVVPTGSVVVKMQIRLAPTTTADAVASNGRLHVTMDRS